MSEIPPSVSDESGGGSRWAQPGVVTIRCRQDGPLVIELPAAGDGEPARVRVIDHEGGEFPLPNTKRGVALCRCGRSARRPFCDGSHREADFRAADRASPEPAEPGP